MLIKKILPFLVLFAINETGWAENPCYGQGEMFNLIDRPNNADSACTIPAGKVEFEAGYQYQQLYSTSGNQQNFPELELRYGLPADSEIFAITPNYNHQNTAPTAGFSQGKAGFKHQFWYNPNWIITADAYVSFKGGSNAFGNQGNGAAVNLIVSYNITSSLNVVVQAGESNTTDSILEGGKRYNSFNPDVVLSWNLNDKYNLYGEIYGLSKTGANAGWGVNMDIGLLYLLRENIVLDVNGSQRISGNAGGFQRYIGAGLSVLL